MNSGRNGSGILAELGKPHPREVVCGDAPLDDLRNSRGIFWAWGPQWSSSEHLRCADGGGRPAVAKMVYGGLRGDIH